MLVPQLTVAENILLGLRVTRNGIVDWKQINLAAKDVLDRLGFKIDPKRRVAHLSVHERQVVEIAKALALDAKFWFSMSRPLPSPTRRPNAFSRSSWG